MSAQETTAVESVETAERPNVTYVETLKPAEDKPEAEKPAEVEEAKESTEEAKTEEAAEEGQERDEKGKFKPKLQDRFDELTRQKHEASREAAYWRGIAESRATKEQPQADAEPKAEDFSEYGDYVRALAKHEAKALVKAELAQQDAQRQEAAKATTWHQRAEAVKADLPDFDQVMRSSSAPMTQAMAEAIKESEIGPRLAYHLAQNPEVAAKLASMSPLAAAMEIGKIGASLSTAAASPPPQKRITSAPIPPTTVGSGKSTSGDPGKMSQADYMEWRKTALKESR